MTAALVGFGVGENIATWLPPFSFSVVNNIIPNILGYITDFEQWDFAEEEIRANMWKGYYTTIFNVVIFLGLQFTGYLLSYASYESDIYNCKEDYMADNLLRIVILELGLRIWGIFFDSVYYYLRQFIVRNTQYKQEFDVNDEFIWFVQFRIWMWLTTYFYPIMALFEVVIMLIHLRYMIFTIKNDKLQPTAASNDLQLGNTMMKNLTVSFLINAFVVAIFLYRPLSKSKFWVPETKQYDNRMNCGPFINQNKGPMMEVNILPDDDDGINMFFTSAVL